MYKSARIIPVLEGFLGFHWLHKVALATVRFPCLTEIIITSVISLNSNENDLG